MNTQKALLSSLKTLHLRFAGYGGQGVLFAGRVVANAAMMSGLEVTWLPSYGPEVRGGTCNCSIIISDQAIGAPQVNNPEIVLAMNKLSYEHFVDSVVPGGLLIADDSTFSVEHVRNDISNIIKPYAQIATDAGLVNAQGIALSNLLMLGDLWKETQFCSEEILDRALVQSIPARKTALLKTNRAAIKRGKEL